MRKVKIEILKDVIANVGGYSMPLKEGEEVQLPKDTADMLIRGHYAKKVIRRRRRTDDTDSEDT